jgi:hypothetical protein
MNVVVANWLHLRCKLVAFTDPLDTPHNKDTSPNYGRQEPSGAAVKQPSLICFEKYEPDG